MKRGGPVRTIVALVLTSVVIGLAYAHLWIKAERDETAAGSVYALLLKVSVADFGQWLSGVAGALAFIWLVFAYFQQSEELTLQRAELALQRAETRRLADEASRQAKSIEASERLARRDTFMRLFDLGQSIQATLLRSIDSSFFGSAVNNEANNTKRDFYLVFSNYMDQRFLRAEKRFRWVANSDGTLHVSLWTDIAPGRKNWRMWQCRIEEIEQLLWFDEMLTREATDADETGALVKFVEALPAQKALFRIRKLLAEATDEPRPVNLQV